MATEIWPVTIMRDRYNGTYSKGKWVAFNQSAYRLPALDGYSDTEAREFWRNPGIFVGRGDTPDEAYNDLASLLAKIAKETELTYTLTELITAAEKARKGEAMTHKERVGYEAANRVSSFATPDPGGPPVDPPGKP